MGASPKEDAWQAPTDVNLLLGLQSSVVRYFNKGRYCTVQGGLNEMPCEVSLEHIRLSF